MHKAGVSLWPLPCLKLWFTVLECHHRTSCIVSGLVVGNSYVFRVFAKNQCGLSETAPITAELAHIQKAGEPPHTHTHRYKLGRVMGRLKRGRAGFTALPSSLPAVTVHKIKGFDQRDFSEAPRFTQPLADCTTVTGYDTQLFCCVRASPRVSP